MKQILMYTKFVRRKENNGMLKLCGNARIIKDYKKLSCRVFFFHKRPSLAEYTERSNIPCVIKAECKELANKRNEITINHACCTSSNH